MTSSRAATTVATALGTMMHVLAGVVTLPLAFFIAYAFADEITGQRHVTFLIGVASAASLTTIVAIVVLRSVVDTWSRAANVATSTAMVVYGAALAVGTLVSLAHEDQNSVTADQPDLPFLLLVAACLVLAAIGVQRTVRALGRDAASGSPGPPSGPPS